jgi:hypothetical protein
METASTAQASHYWRAMKIVRGVLSALAVGVAVEYRPLMVRRIAERSLWTAVVAVSAFLLVTALLAVRTVSKLNVPGHPNAEQWGLADFRDNAYYPTVALLQGENPYDAPSYVQRYPVRHAFPPYSPLTLGLHLPLALMSFERAEVVYWLLTASLALPLAGLALAACRVRMNVAAVAGIATLVLLSRPGHWNQVLGQSAMALTVATYGALHYLRTRSRLAGACLAVATIKLTFGIPLGVLMVAMKGGRAVFVGIVVAACVSLAVAVSLASAAGSVASLAASMLDTAAAFAAKVDVAATGDGFRVDVIGLVGRLSGHEPGVVAQLLAAGTVLAIGALGVARSRRSGRDEAHLAPSLACVTMLICLYHNAYDMLLLTFPLTAAVTARRVAPWSTHPALHGCLLGCLVFPLANYLASDSALGALAVGRGTRAWVAIMSMDGAALLLAFVILVAATWVAGGTQPTSARGARTL